MENNEKWVEDRLKSLAPPAAWKPDTVAALGKVKERDRVHRRRARWMWSGMAASLLGLAILLTPAKCAFGVCRTGAQVPAAEPIREAEPAPPPAPAPVAAAPERPHPAPVPPQPVVPIYKESGDPHAPIVCELFTDYECPHCAVMYDQLVPMLRAEYVQSGKVKFVHRDYPLPMHHHARLAARYANAAGQIGKYELVVNQIFRTQAIWSRSGDVDSQVAQVVDAATMNKIRDLVRNDGHLDDTVVADLAIASRENLTRTPSMVVTHKGKRQVLSPIPPYNLLKSYLDDLLAK
jgi:protein-disulfide isomerase